MSDIISAKEVLWKHRRQLDADGIEVGVSRQALDVVLEELARPTPSPAPSAGLSEEEKEAMKAADELGDAPVFGTNKKYCVVTLAALVRRLLSSKPDPEREAMERVVEALDATDIREWKRSHIESQDMTAQLRKRKWEAVQERLSALDRVRDRVRDRARGK